MANKSGLKKNFLYSMSYQIMTIILPLITAPYVARVLGAKNIGIYSKSQALAHYFLLFAMLGVTNYGNRAIARVRDDKAEVSKTFWEIYALQFITAGISTLSYCLFCILGAKENRLIYMMQSFYVMSGLVDVNWCCFGLERFKLTALRSMTVRVLTAVAVFAFVKTRNDLWIYTLILSVSFIISGVAVWPFIKHQIFFVKPTLAGIKRHIKPNLVLFWPVIAVSIYNIMDKLMLGWFSEDEEVAFYTYAERIVRIPSTIILALDNVVMPRMSNLFAVEGRSEQAEHLMDKVMLFAMFMAAAMGFGLAGVANVFAPWFYGNAFTRCGYYIILLCPVIVVKAWAGALRTQFIIPSGKDRIYIISLTAGAIINLIVNMLLIPAFDGVGAIIGTMAAETTVCFIQFFMCRHDIKIEQYIKNGLGFCVIGAIMYAVVAGLSDISNRPMVTMLVQIMCGGILYIALSCFYMIRILKDPSMINEGLKMLRMKRRG